MALSHGVQIGAAFVVFYAFLAALALIDWRTKLLPDKLTLPLLWAGLLFNALTGFIPSADAVLGAVVGYVSLWALFWAVFWVSGQEGLGYGDFKLLAALGAWLGVDALLDVCLVASACSLLFILARVALRRGTLNDPIAFGPWLTLGGAVAALAAA